MKTIILTDLIIFYWTASQRLKKGVWWVEEHVSLHEFRVEINISPFKRSINPFNSSCNGITAKNQNKQTKKPTVVWIQTLYHCPLYITQGKSYWFNELGLSHLEDKGIGYLEWFLKISQLWNFLTSFSLINSWVPQINLVKYYNCSQNSAK